jgi:DNA-binding winged helix-turn-helix (wHTH) protein
MPIPTSSPLRFGLFEFDPKSGELRKRGLSVRLTPQARALLCVLAEAPNRTRSREEIQRRLWPENTFVDFERGVNKVVHSLREALGESARNPRFIETVAAEGYRFLCTPVGEVSARIEAHSTGVIERLAVLPLKTQEEAELGSMGRVITWILTERLATVPGMRIMAESTVRRHQLENADPRQVGECLGVGAVLAGELTRQNGELILQFELIDAVDGALRGGAMIERAWQAGVRCERELALEAFRRIRTFLYSLRGSRKLAQRLTPVERDEKAS